VRKRFFNTMLLWLGLMITMGGLAFGSSWDDQLDVLLPKRNLTEQESTTIRGVFIDAESRRIPTELLMPRLEEGLAKQVSPEGVAQVLNRELAAYDTTRALILQVLGQKAGDQMLQAVLPWTRTVLLALQGTPDTVLAELLKAFNQQKSKDKWDNYRFGCTLYAALLQWGMDQKDSLALVVAVSKSTLPGSDYRGVLDLIIAGGKLRVSPEVMTERIIQAVPKARSIEVLETRVLY